MSDQWTLGAVINRINKNLELNMLRAMTYAAGESKKLISRPAGRRKRARTSGRTYSRERAQPPPTPPRVVTGQLRSSLSGAVLKSTGGDIRGAFGVRKGVAEKYGFYQEFGTSKMKARPFLRSTLARHKKRIFHLIIGGK